MRGSITTFSAKATTSQDAYHSVTVVLRVESAMTQSTIGVLVGCVVVAVAAIALVRRYWNEHPGESVALWLDSHHMGWMHRKH